MATSATKSKSPKTNGQLPEEWSLIRFDEFAENIATRVDPAETAAQVYLGLEHLDPESLEISRHGEPSDVIGQKLAFLKGDIIFGRRRAYQRKLGVAAVDGICSAHAMVVRAKPDAIEPDFLPFFLQSDSFMERAVEISVGSLSPTINWKTLRKQQFRLPPRDEQRKIVVVLRTIDTVRRHVSAAIAACNVLRDSIAREFLRGAIGGDGIRIKRNTKLPDGWKILTGQQLLDEGHLVALQDGNHGGQYPRSDEFGAEGFPYLSATYISEDGNIDLAACPRLPEERAAKLRIPPAQGGDVILTNNATVGRVAMLPDDVGTVVASTSTTYYRLGAGLDRQYLIEFLRSPSFQWQLSRVMMQSTRNQVPITAQKKLLFVVPPLPEQRRISSTLQAVQLRYRALDEHLAIVEALRLQLRKELVDK